MKEAARLIDWGKSVDGVRLQYPCRHSPMVTGGMLSEGTALELIGVVWSMLTLSSSVSRDKRSCILKSSNE